MELALVFCGPGMPGCLYYGAIARRSACRCGTMTVEPVRGKSRCSGMITTAMPSISAIDTRNSFGLLSLKRMHITGQMGWGSRP